MILCMLLFDPVFVGEGRGRVAKYLKTAGLCRTSEAVEPGMQWKRGNRTTAVTHARFLYWQTAVWIESQTHLLQVPRHRLLVVPRISNLCAEEDELDTSIRQRLTHDRDRTNLKVQRTNKKFHLIWNTYYLHFSSETMFVCIQRKHRYNSNYIQTIVIHKNKSARCRTFIVIW